MPTAYGPSAHYVSTSSFSLKNCVFQGVYCYFISNCACGRHAKLICWIYVRLLRDCNCAGVERPATSPTSQGTKTTRTQHAKAERHQAGTSAQVLRMDHALLRAQRPPNRAVLACSGSGFARVLIPGRLRALDIRDRVALQCSRGLRGCTTTRLSMPLKTLGRDEAHL